MGLGTCLHNASHGALRIEEDGTGEEVEEEEKQEQKRL